MGDEPDVRRERPVCGLGSGGARWEIHGLLEDVEEALDVGVAGKPGRGASE